MLQSISSVFVVYRRKTLTGSLDPTHANGMDKPCIIGGESGQPKEGKPGSSKSKGKQLGDQPAQAAEGAEAPPEETPPDPNPTRPHTDPAPVDPQPGTSKAPTQAPTGDPTQTPTEDPTQTATKNPDEDKPPALTKYVMEYKVAGKAWLESVVKDKEEAYIKLFDKLMELGNPYIDNFN